MPTKKSATLIQDYLAAVKAQNKAHAAMDKHFMSKIKRLIGNGEIEQAQAIANNLPDSVCKAFAFDALRQARRAYNLYP